MKKYKRIFTIVMDSVGFGSAYDSDEYGDMGADTILHTSAYVKGMYLPTLRMMGAGNLHHIIGVEASPSPKGYYLRMQESSCGKDTISGHWEMMGLNISEPFITFTDTGFPDELINELKERTGHEVIGNRAASGTEIINTLGEEHIATGAMIVYTSADSVLQIACHEDWFGLDELYRCCEIARDITMKPEWKLGRVIGRPFIGSKHGEFKRTPNRRDLALKPFGKTVLNSLEEGGYDVIGIGKINDIFAGEGITYYEKSKSSQLGMDQTIAQAGKDFTGLCFVNLVDFDAKWGHRRNAQGYAEELEAFDRKLAELVELMNEDDLIMVTADHGNDPTWTGTDHTREMVPLLMYSPGMKGAGALSTSFTFADIGATIADNFEVEMPEYGSSLLDKLI
ncbi:MAG: phosphopentomutase [Erysipelotrichaceae bacterium]|nr:phosphopentomutase [Erysipelotrichaceae bacterium]